MNFSEAFRCGNKQCKIAPNGRYLASAVSFRLVVRDMATLQIQKLFACTDEIEDIQWSGDSQFILCCIFKRGILQVRWMEEPDWQCKIDEGGSGLVAAMWSPDSRHIITTADFHLRMTIWSLTSKSISYIKHPKPCTKGVDFSRDGRLMVVAERRNLHDYVSIFRTCDWTLLEHFEVGTSDLDSLMMAPDCKTLAVVELRIQYGVYLYSTEGRLLGQYSAYSDALGIKTACWSSTSQFLALGSFDQKVRVVNNVTWRPCFVASHLPVINAKSVLVYKECITRAPTVPENIPECTGSLFKYKSKYEVMTGKMEITERPADMDRECPNIGVSHVSFSPDCKFMCTRNETMPKAVWLWDLRIMRLSTVLIQHDPIRDAQWDPCCSRLALCTGSNKVYMWSQTGSLAVDVPVEGLFLVQSLGWSPDGKALVLQGANEFCVCFLH